MTDLHTHILPGIDDGAKTVEESLQLLRIERSQGVDTVVLTPHFYRSRENPKRFLERRKEAVLALGRGILELSEEERTALPNLFLGAEVAWWPTLAEWDELPELCLGKTKYLLLELPFTPWNGKMIDLLYELYGRTGITPVIAHLERYLKMQSASYIDEILRLGFPVQISAEMLLRPLTRGRGLKLLKQGRAQVIASDCHSCEGRKPNLGPAMEILKRKLNAQQIETMLRNTDALLGASS